MWVGWASKKALTWGSGVQVQPWNCHVIVIIYRVGSIQSGEKQLIYPWFVLLFICCSAVQLVNKLRSFFFLLVKQSPAHFKVQNISFIINHSQLQLWPNHLDQSGRHQRPCFDSQSLAPVLPWIFGTGSACAAGLFDWGGAWMIWDPPN